MFLAALHVFLLILVIREWIAVVGGFNYFCKNNKRSLCHFYLKTLNN